ncbi:DUF2332 domain-containing protein [Actinoplanes sp. CA-142083]|uniref:DUF2332 domain-containing protein n=1 Tax=Actinoplanes sp. CA-142083 TaxID=3239903 RepID=UPI003D8E0250
MPTAMIYAEFAAREASGVSDAYEKLALAVARDRDLIARLDTLPPAKRQPNLLFAAVRFLDGPVTDPDAFLEFADAHWPAVEAEMLTRATQTNEVGRCALLLPILAGLKQPLALLEIGASAGLNLFSDRYSYRYGDLRLGTGDPVLDCALTGREPPRHLPEVVWRAGLDLTPRDITDPDDLRWLESLIWPEHTHRRERLRAAAEWAKQDPPLLLQGDLVDDLPGLAERAPEGATLVVFHTSVLYQVPAERRETFISLVRDLPGHWISVENPTVLDYGSLPNPPDETLHNVLALDGRPLAWCRPHGQAMTWFADAGPCDGRLA